MKLSVPVVNAFVADGDGGNPAGVVLNADSLTDEQMQKIATQVGASETAFILKSDEFTQHVRFFTPTTEVRLCGHATVASWSLMNQQGIYKPGTYTQLTMAGIIDITVDDSGLVFIGLPKQDIGAFAELGFVIKALNITESDLNVSFKPQVIHGNLMVCLNDEDALNRLQPDLEYMKLLYKEQGIDGFHVFVYVADEILAKVRDFCPGVGINEDAATGTANGALLAYLDHLNKLPKQAIYTIEQGVAMGQPSKIYGKLQSGRFWVGGNAKESKELLVEL